MKKVLLFIVIILAFSYRAAAQDFSITIDGEKDAWYDQLTGPENGMVYLPSISYLRDVGNAPDDNADISAIVWLSYDEDFLYCYMEAQDDFVTASNASRYLNDCIEIKFDPDPNSGTGTATSNLRMTALGVDDAENPEGVDNLNGSGHLESDTGNDLVVLEEDYARRFIDGGYALEFRVPFDYINEPEDDRFMVERIVGNVFGMAINLGDNDSGTRDHMLQWSAGHTDAAHSEAAQHGSATFMADHILKLEAVSPRDPSIVNDSADVWYDPPATSVEINPLSIIPKEYSLKQNYPNPFNPTTNFEIDIPKSGFVSLVVYDVLGNEIAVLINEEKPAGVYTATFNASGLPSGVYMYRLTTRNYSETRKMMLMK